MPKFLVLNQAFQPMNPYQYNFFQDQGDDDDEPNAPSVPRPPANHRDMLQMMMFNDEEKAKKFAEHLAKLQTNQSFYLSEVKAKVQSDPPVVWNPGI